MKNRNYFYGYIKSALYKGENFYLLHELNSQEIDKLPEYDNYPYLSRGMFKSTKDPILYREPLITIGGTFKELEPFTENFDLWVVKFEKLLSKMYWYRVVLHIEIFNTISSSRNNSLIFIWEAKDEYITNLLPNKPIKNWFFNMNTNINNTYF
ncbi:MAG: hypothetical protein U0457_18305 [Candidatus Sericytochromatia bacterium]